MSSKGPNAEDTPNERPAQRYICDVDGSGDFANVPVQEDGRVGDGKVIVAV